ncbi:DUF2894 domain-containing protein, partial [Bordetella bronchiseptica]
MTDDAARQAQARLDAWRERGGEQADPLRFHYLQALARRAAGHEGQAWAEGMLWVGQYQPRQILQLDPATG